MNNKKRERDEYLEQLWSMKEKKIKSIDELKKKLHVKFNKDFFQELINEGIVKVEKDEAQVTLTEYGERQARQVIRAHRLAERLIRDVLGLEYEKGADEFEHTMNIELLDGICTLLGHPRECPHGKPIPEGECCKIFAKQVTSSVISIKELEVGETAKVAYIQVKDDKQMHRLDGLQIRPGADIKLHQKYPTFVVECEGLSIAIDEEVASNIRVWIKLACAEISRDMVIEKRGFLKRFRQRRRACKK
ncbi:MAG: metal-dependent transcriptional regulator [Pseudomonadota bacterium]